MELRAPRFREMGICSYFYPRD